ncbi:hypothetical protein M408DRAFT_29232 [Serendipita vermifera MAFF 305830]|uniref:DUF7918 domain-containing protein n=1 Tax=Serendipita vermifera MAFF 305830 TaxID=933852 RepID=A0A0C2WWW1_SERVB|nr:hypothetical protein M408DRAFT_29232 [Serendipita vermifera MAFF 305830]
MPTLKGITARIMCDGKPLEEYATITNPESPSSVGCWVASQTDKVFELSFLFEPHKEWGWSCELDCDGEDMGGITFWPEDISGVIDLVGTGPSLYPMIFSEILETEEAADIATNPFLGIIRVKCWRTKPGWTILESEKSQEAIKLSEAPIHETKKMLGGHRVKLGEPEPNDTETVKVVYLDTDPHVVFDFQYRPMGLLQALGHCPRPTELSEPKRSGIKREAPTDSESESASESDGEEEKVAAQLHILQQKKENLRREREERRSKRKHKRVKTEDNEIRVPPTAKGVLIDLCSD